MSCLSRGKSWFIKTMIASSLAMSAVNAHAAGGILQIMQPFEVKLERYQFTQNEGEPFQVVIDDHEVVGCGTDRVYKQSILEKGVWFIDIMPDPGAGSCSAPKVIRAGAVVGFDTRQTKNKQPLTVTVYIKNNVKKPGEEIALTVMSDKSAKVSFTDLGEEAFNYFRIYDSVGASYKLDLALSNPQMLGCWPQKLAQHNLEFSYYLNGQILPSDNYLYLDLTGNCSAKIPAGAQLKSIQIDEMTVPSFRMISIMVPVVPFAKDTLAIKPIW